MTVAYREGPAALDGLGPAMLAGFFEGWPDPPGPETHLRLLRGSDHVVLAVDEGSGAVVGFVTAITDGVLTAFVPLLEVRPAWRGRGIGSELLRRLLARLDGTYAVDLACDDDLVPFYERLGFAPGTAMLRRDRAALRRSATRE